jgi:hypothetical protein
VSVLTQERRVDFAGSEVSTPQLRRTGRRALFWIVLVVLLLIFVGITFALTGTSEDKDRLSATNAHGNGAEALINVLRNDGVEVTTPHTIGAAERDASAHGPTTTLVIYDQRSILLRSQFADLDRVAGNIILIEPDSAALSAFTPGILQAVKSVQQKTPGESPGWRTATASARRRSTPRDASAPKASTAWSDPGPPETAEARPSPFSERPRP